LLQYFFKQFLGYRNVIEDIGTGNLMITLSRRLRILAE